MSLLLLVLLAEMAIAVIGSGYSFRLTAVSFFLRLIPSLILALAIYIAWRRERAGGLLFILFGLTYYLITEGTFLYKLPLTIFFLVCGSLFLLSHRYCQKNK
jgi:hypothetical protein